MHEIYSENTVGIDFSIHTSNVFRKHCNSVLFDLRTMLTGASGALEKGAREGARKGGEKRGRERGVARHL